MLKIFKLHKAEFLLLSVLFSTVLSLAQEKKPINISDTLLIQAELENTTEPVKNYLFDSVVSSRLSRWVNNPKVNSYFVDCQLKLRPFFKSEKIISSLCYVLRQPVDQRMQAADLMQRYVIEIAASLFELQADPRYPKLYQDKAKQMYSLFLDTSTGRIKNFKSDFLICLKPALGATYSQDGAFKFSPFQFVANCLNSQFPRITTIASTGDKISLPMFAVNLNNEFPKVPGHAISPSGWTIGNSIRYNIDSELTDTDRSSLLILKNKFISEYSINGNGSLEAMQNANLDNVFTMATGVPNLKDHVLFQNKNNFYSALVHRLESAQETVFIDMNMLGGSIGASFAKFLTDQLKMKSNLKVLIMTDLSNQGQAINETLPVYNYLLAYSKNNPSRLIILNSYASSKKPIQNGFVSSVIQDNVVQYAGLNNQLLLAQGVNADRSKVIIIDGASLNPVAFVGVKNMIDSDEVYSYSESVEIAGPAAAVMQNDYYKDMKLALVDGRRFGKGYSEFLARNGWSKNLLQPSDSPETAIQRLLLPFDLLKRDLNGQPTMTKPILIMTVGQSIVRTGFNNADHTQSNIIDEIIQGILVAQKSIYIQDLYLFDPQVVRTLIKAKKTNPTLDVRVILSALGSGFKDKIFNVLYLDQLNEAGIIIKFKNNISNEGIFSSFNMASISVDGYHVIVGSAHKDIGSMTGLSREQQVNIYDTNVVSQYNQNFLKLWDAMNITNASFQQYDFAVPAEIKDSSGKTLTPVKFVQYIRAFFELIYESNF